MYDIFSINSNGQNLINLTNNPLDDILPLISPDGAEILFTSNRSGNSDIWIMDIYGNDKINLTKSKLKEKNYNFSYDCKKIVYEVWLPIEIEMDIPHIFIIDKYFKGDNI